MKAKSSYKPTGPIHPQHEDVWSRCKSINGFAIDELRSVLQKSIRRGLLEEAILAAFELYMTGPETEELLWRRLEIIASEDIGFGMINAPILLEALNTQRLRMPHNPDRFVYAAHAVRVLTTAKKDRTSMELGAWAEAVVNQGERQVVVHDYQVDHHTRRGREMGRGRAHWWHSGGAVLENLVEGLETRWGDYLRELYPPGPKPRKKSGKRKRAA
jgi:replication-associated recombination protein RarA